MGKIHSIKDGKLHIYVRTDKYKGKLKSDNYVGRTYIQGKQKIVSSGTNNLNKAKVILSKWYDELQTMKKFDITIHQNGILVKPVRLANGLYKFRNGTGFDRVVLDCITSLQNGADLLWIETEKPNVCLLYTSPSPRDS